MAYNNGQKNAMAAAELPWMVKGGIINVDERWATDDALPNNWSQFVDNAAGTAKIHHLIAADGSNQTYMRNPNGVKAYALQLVQMATPGAPTITNGGTAGATTDAYKIVARNGGGVTIGSTPASTAGTTTTANATLSATNFNIITFPNVTGAAFYDVYRTTAAGTPSTTGLIGTVAAFVVPTTGLQSATYVFNDTGLVGDGTTAPTANTSGALAAPVIAGSISPSQLTTPVGVVATPQGTAGSTTISYKIVARANTGTTAASSAGTTTTANATLSASNNVLVTWDPVPGAVSYDVYRTAAGGTPSTTGLVANVLVGTTSYTDTGAAGDSTTAPTVNTTGAITTPGPATVGQFAENTTDQAIATSTTITAPNLIGGIIRCTTSATSTTDTAANIVAQIPNCQVGSTFSLYVISASGQTHTLALGSGVTAAATVQTTLTTATVTAHQFLFRVTNVGTPAVVIYSLGAATS